MSSTTLTKKRKSVGETITASKKVKTVKAVDKAAPLKSALKKPKDEVALKKTDEASRTEKDKKVKTTTNVAPVENEAVEKKSTKPKKAKSGKLKEIKNVEELTALPNQAGGADIEDTPNAETVLTEDQTAALIAGFSSSEDEASEDEEGGIAVSKLPQVPSVDDIQKQIKDDKASDSEKTPGVIYVGRIPHGFYEKQMKAYFSQFGEILHMRLARNHKTGKSQHYAFIEFASSAVAEIVAKTMDKYLLFGHILQVRTVPQGQVKENMWDGTGKRKKPAPRNRLEGSHLRRGLVKEDWEQKINAENKKRVEKAQKLRDLGYEFEVPNLKSVSEVWTKGAMIEEAKKDKAHTEQNSLDDHASESAMVTEAPTIKKTKSKSNDIVVKSKPEKKRMSIDGSTKKAKKMKV